jgi:hypothetical protein
MPVEKLQKQKQPLLKLEATGILKIKLQHFTKENTELFILYKLKLVFKNGR